MHNHKNSNKHVKKSLISSKKLINNYVKEIKILIGKFHYCILFVLFILYVVKWKMLYFST